MFAMAVLGTVAAVASAADGPEGASRAPAWVEAMRRVHEGFDGQAGYVAQFGDSITHSLAFWSPIDWDDPDKYLAEDGLPKRPGGRRWRDVVRGARAKGGEHGNGSGWRVPDVLRAADEVLRRDRPEVVLVMIGTNDVSGGKVPRDFRRDFEALLRKCLAARCVPIVGTIPPRRGHDAAVAELNAIVRETAKELSVPLVDYHAAILERRPKDWDGSLISPDGVHPSAGQTNVYTAENLSQSGYALRNWLCFLALREVHFRVLHPDQVPAK
jgi:lysophospholipase L1-like esterase